MSKNQTSKEKIKEVARTIFMKKGYAGTKTRDITTAAGINLAALNYHYQSKENLFKEVMMESMSSFFQQILAIFRNEESTLEEKLEQLTVEYIGRIKTQPDIPFFIFSELRFNSRALITQITGGEKLENLVFFRQLKEQLKNKKREEIDPLQIIANLMSMIFFPFIAKPMLQAFGDMNEQQFDELIEKRKKLIPQWIYQMIGE
ncbi:MAG: TetR/AcrR family transcriptional regulator [Thermonemataceae bacterium]